MLVYNLDYIKNENGKNEIKKFIKDYQRKEPLKVLNIENGIILPQKTANYRVYPNAHMGLGGVLDQFDNFVELSGIKALFVDDMVFGGKYDYIDQVEECDEDVLYMGVFQPQWGHFMIEYCTRLWYSLQCKNRYKIAYCGYNCEKDKGVQGSYKEFFELLGIKKEQLIDIRKPTRYRKIIIPEQSFLRNRYYTEEYRYIIDTIYKNVNVKDLVPCDKIYFSRVCFTEEKRPDKEHGEREIQETFKKNGYKIIAPETLSLKEQIFYVRNCNELAVIPGSTSENIVFAQDNTRRIYVRKANVTIPEIFQIEQMVNAEKITFVDCYYTPYKHFPIAYGAGPHFIGFTKEFKLFLKNNNMMRLKRYIYYFGIVGTQIWLTKMALLFMREKYKDKKAYNKINNKINVLLGQSIKKFIIYPYGKIGKITKDILDNRGINTYILVDHYKCLTDNMILDVDALNDKRYSDYKVLLCSDSKGVHHESIKVTVNNKVDNKDRIIEVI